MVRRLSAVLLTGVLLTISIPWIAPAHGADNIPTQEYVSVLGLDKLKAEGFDGSGVTIAVIDTPIDLSVPELQGADITVKAACQSGGTFHGTSVLSALTDPVWGFAPKARFFTYAHSAVGTTGYDEPAEGCEGNMDDHIHWAINDGADIISISSTMNVSPYTLARAAWRGIPIVRASGNDGDLQTSPRLSSAMNLVVAVGMSDLDGQPFPVSSWGEGLTITIQMGQPLCRVPGEDGQLSEISQLSCVGTSNATPMVAGALALAMQKWPEANGNQIIASMMDTATRKDSGWGPKYGWGLINPIALVNNDPSQYSTEHPLMDAVEDGYVSRDDYNDYANGTIEFASMVSEYDLDYPPGQATTTPPEQTDTTPPSSPDPTGAPGENTGLVGSGLLWMIIGGVSLLAVAVVIVVLVRRGRHSTSAVPTPSSPPYPPVQGLSQPMSPPDPPLWYPPNPPSPNPPPAYPPPTGPPWPPPA